jgi:CBS domain-containing protein
LSDAIDVDGTHRYGLRVFCDVRQHSVPLDVCKACSSCLAIDGSPLDGGCVRCAPPEQSVPVDAASTGRALHRGLVAVDRSVLVRDVVELFVKHSLRLVVVTDGEGRAEGVVHESQLVQEIQNRALVRGDATHLGWESIHLEPASALMRPPATIGEDVPLHIALAEMTAGHQRQLLVLDANSTPVGILFDVDALHALYGRDE